MYLHFTVYADTTYVIRALCLFIYLFRASIAYIVPKHIIIVSPRDKSFASRSAFRINRNTAEIRLNRGRYSARFRWFVNNYTFVFMLVDVIGASNVFIRSDKVAIDRIIYKNLTT